MSTRACDDVHQALQRALERGDSEPDLDVELGAHVRACGACAEAVDVATRLRQVADEQPARDGLPSASHLWWRARIIRDLIDDETAVERATRPIRWLQLGLLGLLCLLVASALTGLSAHVFGDLRAQIAAGSMPWRLLAGLLVAGTALPLAGFSALWVLWRET